ncbi:hypothetical protein LINPERHAP1_LOCUS40280 [Linum perenne]
MIISIRTGDSWMVLDHYLVVHQWDHSFRVSEELPKKMVVWVRLPSMLIHFYHPHILTSLGNLMGKQSKSTLTPKGSTHGKFAHIAIEINLSEPLAPVIDLDGAI